MHTLYQIVWLFVALVLMVGLVAFVGAFIALTVEGFKERSHRISNSIGKTGDGLPIRRLW